MAPTTHPLDISFDEKSDYEQRRSCYRKNRSSTSSSSSHSEPCPPPRYSLRLYNTLEEKPLPALPNGQRRVQFVLQKPLPPLPQEEKNRKRSGSEGDYAWWALRRLQMDAQDDGEDDFAVEKRGY